MASSAYHHSKVEPMEVDEEVWGGLPGVLSACSPLVTSESFCGRGREQVSSVQELHLGNLPDNWIRMSPGRSALAVVVEPNTEEYTKVAFQFLSSMKFPESEVKNVFHIQNPFLWQHYALKHQEMVEENGGKEVLEKHLFHGTKCSNIDAICRKGFDWRLCGRHGTKYGQGCYFARDSKYSHTYSPVSCDPKDRCDILESAVFPDPSTLSSLSCSPMDCDADLLWTQYRHSHHQMPQQSKHPSFGGGLPHNTMQKVLPFQPAKFTSPVHVHSPNWPSVDGVNLQPQQAQRCLLPNNSRYMFLARVLVGNTVRGHADYRRPPAVEPGNPLSKHYDSCVDCSSDPGIHVVFDSNQVYPEYIVEYNYLSKKG